jgi:Domain of unknown function (DUF4349)
MNTDIRYLQLLGDDLAEAARTEHERETRTTAPPGGPPRRPPRRGGRHWGQIAAALVVLVVLAGSIGFLAQGGGVSSSSDDSGGAALEATDQLGSPGQATAVPAPAAERDQGAALAAGGGALNGSEAGADQAFDASGPPASANSIGQVPGPQQDLSKIVRDGRISVEIANGAFDRNVTAVSRIANGNGGFVLTSATQNGQTGTFTLRIPARRFDVAMEQLRSLGTVKADEVTGQDVTAEFIDLKARLEILEDRRDLLRDLQADATSSSEILRFATLIDDVQFEIEKIQGNLNFIDDQVAEATIRVSLREQDAPESEQSPGDIDKPKLSTSLDYAVQGFLRVLGAVVVGLGYLIPIGVIALIVWLAVRLVRRRDRGAS